MKVYTDGNEFDKISMIKIASAIIGNGLVDAKNFADAFLDTVNQDALYNFDTVMLFIRTVVMYKEGYIQLHDRQLTHNEPCTLQSLKEMNLSRIRNT